MISKAAAKGRRAEKAIAYRLSRWATPHYLFRRRGLGHAGVADLIVDTIAGPPWPFTISVKSAQGPTLPAMLERIRHGRVWPWWAELEIGQRLPLNAELELVGESALLERNRVRAWLIWRSAATWMLSCWTLGGLTVPPRLTILPLGPGWPAFTMRLDDFLAGVSIEAAMTAIADGWGNLERASARWAP